jgi:hypothetical protein
MYMTTLMILILVGAPVNGFGTFSSSTRSQRQSMTSCRMGGYYSEPAPSGDDGSNGRPQHMIFGVKCWEETLQIPPSAEAIKFLEPIDTDDKESTSASSVAFAKNLIEQLNFNGVKVVELGSNSVVAIALARFGGANVRIYDSVTYQDRLRLLQHADMFLNPLLSSPSSQRVQSGK